MRIDNVEFCDVLRENRPDPEEILRWMNENNFFNSSPLDILTKRWWWRTEVFIPLDSLRFIKLSSEFLADIMLDRELMNFGFDISMGFFNLQSFKHYEDEIEFVDHIDDDQKVIFVNRPCCATNNIRISVFHHLCSLGVSDIGIVIDEELGNIERQMYYIEERNSLLLESKIYLPLDKKPHIKIFKDEIS